jgi:hypothetical protein
LAGTVWKSTAVATARVAIRGHVDCMVCARSLQQAAELVRSGATRRFVLVHVADDVLSPTELRAAMAACLPGWSVSCDDGASENDNCEPAWPGSTGDGVN